MYKYYGYIYINQRLLSLEIFPTVFSHKPRGWWNVDPEPRVGGAGVQPKAEKKIVTSQFLMAEEVDQEKIDSYD